MTEGSLRPKQSDDNNTVSTNLTGPSQFLQVGFTHNAKPRVLRLAYVLSRRQNVKRFIKYGNVEAVRVDRTYCGLEPDG
jgi:hypothetical protein